MRFSPTEIPGVFLVEPERHVDGRGYFARTWCVDEFAAAGIAADLTQCSVAFNERRGTLRGLHYQAAPYEEAKVVRCTRGAAFDVVVDLRVGSPTFRTWIARELTADNGLAIFVPPGCGHGYQTLVDETELLYLCSAPYHPELARGIRWSDETLAIDWPECEGRVMSRRDETLPALEL